MTTHTPNSEVTAVAKGNQLMEKITGCLIGDAKDIVLEDATFRLPDGRDKTVAIVHRPAAVGVAPLRAAVDGGGAEVLLVRQPRPAVDEAELLEVVAGKVDGTEDPLVAARREMGEEVGLQAFFWSELARDLLPSPGFLREPMHLFAAWDLTTIPSRAEDAHIIGTWIGLRDAIGMVAAGEIRDMKTIIALYLLTCETSRTRAGRPWWPCRWCETRNLTFTDTCRCCGR